MTKLKFGKGNAKLSKEIYTFSLPAGFTCPGADECWSRAKLLGDKVKIVDGPNTRFRCFAASQEVLYPAVYRARQHNMQLLRDKNRAEMAELIGASLPKKAVLNRIHVSGDFFSQAYFSAWMDVARENPQRIFYAYTKSLPFWVKEREDAGIPKNFSLTASRGGRHDALIEQFSLRSALVVFSEKEAKERGLPIDHDDSHAIKSTGDFALLLHGVQPKGSEASKALRQLKLAGKGGYKS